MRSLGPAGWAQHGFFGLGAKTFGNPGGALSGDGYFVNGQGGGPPPGGKVWTTLTTGFESSQDQFYRIYYLNNTWVITTTTGTPVNRNTVIVSTDGVHWVQHTVQSGSVIRASPGLAFGPPFVMSRNVNGGAPLISEGALLGWNTRTSSFSAADTLNDPVFGNGVFLLVSNSTPAYATSPDGITWTQQTAYVPTQWGQPVFDGTRFVCPVMGVSNTPKIAVSADGVNWTESAVTLGITDPTVLGFNASTQYVVGEDSDDHGASVNGALTASAAISFNDAGGPSGWIAYASGSDWARCTAINASVSSSPNGISWGTDTVPAAAAFINNMAWNGAEWIAVGSTGAAQNFSMTRGP